MRPSPNATTLEWPSLAEPPPLENSQIHVWCADLTDFQDELGLFKSVLSPAELARAEKFRFSIDRDAYAIRHGILRVVLGRYLEREPSSIEFCYGPHGKPEIESHFARDPVQFNDSHSRNLVLYAVSRACRIGVDIECVKPVPNLEEIAARFFSQDETRELLDLPAELRTEAFYSCWTRKEAVLKATGAGIGEGVAHVRTPLNPSQEVEILHVEESQARRDWQLRSLRPAKGYLAAVAYERADLDLSLWSVRSPLCPGR